jgi:hypothetical protein
LQPAAIAHETKGNPLIRLLADLRHDLLHGTRVLLKDPGIAALLLAVGLMAGHFPARCATRVDPIQALRHEQFRGQARMAPIQYLHRK